MIVLDPDISVLLMDAPSSRSIPKSKWIRVLRSPDLEATECASNVFILAAPEHLSAVSRFVQKARRENRLRALLIRQDENPTWLPQIMLDQGIRTSKNMKPYTDPSVPKRILEAWVAGAQHKLIADATVLGDKLLIASCSLRSLEIPFSLDPLKSIPREQRTAFTIDQDGSSIYWQDADIELDFEGAQSLIDPALMERAKRGRLAHDARFGRAVSALRIRNSLRQEDIEGLSARQVRRIEAGGDFSSNAIIHLARAHGCSPNDYMSKIADLMTSKGVTDAPHRRVRKARRSHSAPGDTPESK